MVSTLCFIAFILITYLVAIGIGYHIGFTEGRESMRDLISHVQETVIFEDSVENRYIDEEIISE